MRSFSAVPSVAEAERHAPEKLKKSLRDFAKLPWEVAMTAEQSADVLGKYLGVPNLEPASVLQLEKDQIHSILEDTTVRGNKHLEKALFSYADAVTTKFFGDSIYYRGIVEFSNVCENDCGYCGIRKHQRDVYRYTMPEEEVVEVARWAFENRMGTLMLQSGELDTPKRLEYLERVIRAVRDATIEMDMAERRLNKQSGEVAPNTDKLGLRVALSVGELSRESYERLFAAGARRYLLRIETSNPELYKALHPPAMSWQRRVDCLKTLKDVGFQIGTGIMVGLPGQTLADVAGDVVFFREIGADMIGMGPYITEAGTPVAEMWAALYSDVDKKKHMRDMLDLTTRVNALARITIGNANIAATTALQAIDPMGREIALRRGSNILMPILTPTKYREHYQLYEGKPCITDSADECRKCLGARISMIGKKLEAGAFGDPPHFLAPITGVQVPASVTLGSVPSSSLPSATTQRAGYHTAAAAAASPQRRGLSTSLWAHQAVEAVAPELSPSAAAASGLAGALGGDLPRPPGTERGSDVPRINVGVFGVMNAGKSTLMNRITRQETSIVDATPGTTADVKTTLMELHEVGPAKLFDTAGIDEAGELGEKKRRKTLSALKESDVALIVVDVARHAAQGAATRLGDSLAWERRLLAAARKQDVVPLLLMNLKGMAHTAAVQQLLYKLLGELDPERECLSLEIDLNSAAADVPTKVAMFLQDGVKRSKQRHQVHSLPEWALRDDAAIFLNIPMDAETPTMRLLRPQALVQEEAIRHWATTTAYRMDLAAARGDDPAKAEAERRRFIRALQPVLLHDGPKLLITDSQAIDIVHPWTLDPVSGAELVPITTFSIAMIHRQSGGRLPLFAEGVRTLSRLSAGDRVLIAEACNHNRITDVCNDIGMVQIPRKLEALAGDGLVLEHAFGREFPELEDGPDGGLRRFKLALHCGGCMIDAQKMRARIADLEEAGLPVTNYGLFLSYVHSPHALRRSLEPWGVSIDA